MSENAARDEWVQIHGEYPLLVLGWRDDRGGFRCLDHPRAHRRKVPVLSGDERGESAACRECGRHLRAAALFGEMSEADLSDPRSRDVAVSGEEAKG